MSGSTEIPGSNPTVGPDGKIVFQDPARKKRGCLKYALIGALVLALLVGGCTVFVLKSTAKAEKQAKAFVVAVINDDVDAAYALTSTDFREGTSKADLAEVTAQLQKLVGGGKIRNTGRAINKESGSDTESTIQYTVTKGSKTLYFTVKLVDTKGWKVVSFDSSPEEPA